MIMLGPTEDLDSLVIPIFEDQFNKYSDKFREKNLVYIKNNEWLKKIHGVAQVVIVFFRIKRKR